MAGMKGKEEELAGVESGKEGRGLKRSRSSPSSSSSSDDDCGKSLCIFAYDSHSRGRPVLYGVDFDSEEKTKWYDDEERNFCKKCCAEIGEGKKQPVVGSGMREITPSESRWEPNGRMIVSVGSTVYILGALIVDPAAAAAAEEKSEGGTIPFSRRVFRFETDKNNQDHEKGWVEAPDMLNARNFGKAVAVDGKIYVLGGNDLKKAPDPWAEVFDPSRNEWDSLPKPLEYIHPGNLMGDAVAYGKGEDKKIIMGNSPKYVYHVKEKSWEAIDEEWGVYGNDVYLVGVGNFLYWIGDGRLWAVNMTNERYYSGEISGSKSLNKGFCFCHDYDKSTAPPLVRLGGKVFSYFTTEPARRGRRTKVCCTKFRITKCLRPGEGQRNGRLKASAMSSVTCIVDRPYLHSELGLVLF